MQLTRIQTLQAFRGFPVFLSTFLILFATLFASLFVSVEELQAKEHKKASASLSSHFPYPAALRPQVEFWKHVFTTSKYTVTLHDTVHMKVYKVLNFQPLYETYSEDTQTRSRLRNERIKREVKKIRARLLKLHKSGKNAQLTAEEQRIRDLYSDIKNPKKFLHAAQKDRIRSQTGIGEKFRRGIQISGRYTQEMEAIFRRAGLPLELTRMPLIESTFDITAYSKVGAAGVWQFMPSTGRLFMRVDRLLDERRDPILATRAAAKLLKSNYDRLGTWPLAITAYNHGPAGIANAVKAVGTTDIARIIRSYKGRSFGFASRNFYPEFLAAVEIEKNHKTYFGDLRRNAPFQYDEIYLTSYLPLRVAAQCANIPSSQLIALNPAFGNQIRNSKRYIPSGYRLRIPDGTAPRFKQQYAALPAAQRPQKQPSLYATHRVRRGQNLAVIAKRYGTSVKTLKRLNRIRRANHIRIGQRLRVPSRNGSVQVASQVASAPTAKKTVHPSTLKLTPTVTSQKQIPKHIQQSQPKLINHTVRRGQTLAAIAGRYRTTVSTLKKLNNIKRANRIRSGQKLRVPATYATHKVRRGQTLAAIAQRYGTTVTALKRINRIKNTRLIQIGQTLRVPLS